MRWAPSFNVNIASSIATSEWPSCPCWGFTGQLPLVLNIEISRSAAPSLLPWCTCKVHANSILNIQHNLGSISWSIHGLHVARCLPWVRINAGVSSRCQRKYRWLIAAHAAQQCYCTKDLALKSTLKETMDFTVQRRVSNSRVFLAFSRDFIVGNLQSGVSANLNGPL